MLWLLNLDFAASGTDAVPVSATKGGSSLSAKEFSRLEKRQLEEQRRLIMIVQDDDEIIALL